ncbi:hypothetical protein PSTG_17871, partial [Puccinia striiformis f. sp. tritici PST-78]
MTNQYRQNPPNAHKNLFITPNGKFITPEAYLASLSLPAAPLRQQQRQVLNSQPHQHQRQSVYQQPSDDQQQSGYRKQQPEQQQQSYQQPNSPGLSFQHQQQSNLLSALRSHHPQQQQQSSPPDHRYQQHQQHISFNTNDVYSDYPSNHNHDRESVDVHERLASNHLPLSSNPALSHVNQSHESSRGHTVNVGRTENTPEESTQSLSLLPDAFPPSTCVKATPINHSAPLEINPDSAVTAGTTNSNQCAPRSRQKHKHTQKEKPPPKAKPLRRTLTKATYNAAVAGYSSQPPSQSRAAIPDTRTVASTTSDVPGSDTTPEERRCRVDHDDALGTRLDRVDLGDELGLSDRVVPEDVLGRADCVAPEDALGWADRVAPEDLLGDEQGVMDAAEQGFDLFDQLDDNDDVPVVQKACNSTKKPRMVLDSETVASLPDQTMDELRRLADEH